MTGRRALVLHDVELCGIRTDVLVEHGRIAAIGAVAAAGAEVLDGRGGALLPGLHDHHIHLLATAARRASVDLSSARTKDALVANLRAALAEPDNWTRGVGYDDTVMGLISRLELDQVSTAHPIRVQDRTGALWVLNSPALERVLGDAPPACVEREADGRPTGRIWRGDAWLRARINAPPPSLHALSRALAGFGITGVTDAGANNGPEEARLLAQKRCDGELLQSLCLMSADAIPPSAMYEIGPVKILPDERDLPELSSVVERIRMARGIGRAVAIHCVTLAELALALAAFEQVGPRDGDRIEHGGIIPAAMFAPIRTLRLINVTQPNFIYDHGDRYKRTVSADEMPDLYRLSSLRAAGIKLAAGSDAPYGDVNPWSAIQAASDRLTKSDESLGADEQISACDALGLFLGAALAPSNPRTIAVGSAADLCLLELPLAAALAEPRNVKVAATIACGKLIHVAL